MPLLISHKPVNASWSMAVCSTVWVVTVLPILLQSKWVERNLCCQSVEGGVDGLWSPHPTAASQGLGKDQCQATQTQKKSLKAQTWARAVFFPLQLWPRKHSRFKWQETQNGRHPADPAGENHPHPCNYGFLQRRGTVHLP